MAGRLIAREPFTSPTQPHQPASQPAIGSPNKKFLRSCFLRGRGALAGQGAAVSFHSTPQTQNTINFPLNAPLVTRPNPKP